MEWLSTMLGEILRRKSRIQNFQITVPVKFSVHKVLNKLDTIILSIFLVVMMGFWRQLLVLDLRAIFFEVLDWTKIDLALTAVFRLLKICLALEELLTNYDQ